MPHHGPQPVKPFNHASNFHDTPFSPVHFEIVVIIPGRQNVMNKRLVTTTRPHPHPKVSHVQFSQDESLHGIAILLYPSLLTEVIAVEAWI